MKHIFSRLMELTENRRKFRPDPQERAGRLAEKEATGALDEAFPDADVRVWRGRRLPDVATGRPRELDFVVAHGTSVATIELKYWVGRVESRDGRVIQHRANGETIDHGQLGARLDARVQSLKALLKDHCESGGCSVESCVLFGHPGLDVPEDFKLGDHAIQIAAAPVADAGMGSTDGRALASAVREVAERLFDTGTEPPPGSETAAEDVADALDEVGTWDRLALHGGRVATGTIDWVVDTGHPLADRKRLREVEFDVTRAWTSVFTTDPDIEGVAHLRDGGSEQFDELALDDVVRFQPVGERVTADVDLRHLERLEFGATSVPDETLDWEDLETGRRYLGRVANIVEFGLFVDLGAPTDGLVHVSNVDRNRHTRAEELPKRFAADQLVDVRLTDIDRSAEELDLVLVHDNPSI